MVREPQCACLHGCAGQGGKIAGAGSGRAWFDEKGTLHPSYGIWALREHARRQIVTMLELRQRFGIGADDCVYTAYYDRANPVVQANPDVAVSTYRRGDRLLLVIGGFAKETVELPLRLRKGRIVRAVDLETGRPLACERGVASLTLKQHDFALVELRGVEML